MLPEMKPFKFYEDVFTMERLEGMSVKSLRSLLEDIQYTKEDIEIWLKANENSDLGVSKTSKLGYKANLLRFERELKRVIDDRGISHQEAFYEVCKRDLQPSQFKSIEMDASKYQRKVEELR